MYYVNRNQIELILKQIPELTTGLRLAADSWDGSPALGFVQERCLHLAIETVTDVGSFLIDGFIMRDAGSYEDIVTVIFQESVFEGQELYDTLVALVALRKPLVQDYFQWERSQLHPMTKTLPDALEAFGGQVERYLERELGAPAAGS